MVRRLSLVLAGALLATGCGSGLRVQAIKPARVNLGAANQLVVVQMEGRRSAQEEVLQKLQEQAREDGYFTTTDRTDSGIMIKAAGRQVRVSGEERPTTPEEIWLRVDVIDWDVDGYTRLEPIKDKDGNKTGEREVPSYKGQVLLAVTAANASGKALLAETEFEATWEADNEEEALSEAADLAVARLLDEVTPTWESKAVTLDEDDPAQLPILELAKDGNLGAAVSQMRQYLEQRPRNPAAQYNLAVLLDAQGEYEAAMELYGQAIKNGSKAFYAESRAECARRLANQNAMLQ